MTETVRIDTSRWQRLPQRRPDRFGILVGGGPAPGINGVISAITIEAILNGCQVVGILDGYRWLAEGRTDKSFELTLDDVAQIHLRGGSILGTSRLNPTEDPQLLSNVVDSLDKLGVNMLATIGGDDTAFSSSRVAAQAGDRIQVAHVPKTIDNDLPLPADMPTFGYQTARHEGVRVLRSLAADAQTTRRWYIAVTMGRKAGHLALGIGKAAGATLTLIPEEFEQGLPLRVLCDVIETTIHKRLAMGRPHGTVVLGEGIIEKLSPDEIPNIDRVGLDEHGHLQLNEIPLGEIVRAELHRRFDRVGRKLGLVFKDIGYELRSADPIPNDQEYTRDLGFGTALYLLSGGSCAMISLQNGELVPIPFEALIDPATGKPSVRIVDITSQSYVVAREYMIRLQPEDLVDPEMLEKLAVAAGLDSAAFCQRFGYLVGENPYLLPVPTPADIQRRWAEAPDSSAQGADC